MRAGPSSVLSATEGSAERGEREIYRGGGCSTTIDL